MRVLVACEFSGVVAKAFRDRGHIAFSCDLLPCEGDSAWHYQGDVFELLARNFDAWDILIAFPPCTYLCRAGWRWTHSPDSDELPLKGVPRLRAAAEAAQFFRDLLSADVPRIAVENPRPIKHVGLPPATQYIQPWEHGHGEVKATGLWLKGLPPLVPSNVVEGREPRVHYASPGADRWRERSRTLPGIAQAMAEQWGGLST